MAAPVVDRRRSPCRRQTCYTSCHWKLGCLHTIPRIARRPCQLEVVAVTLAAGRRRSPCRRQTCYTSCHEKLGCLHTIPRIAPSLVTGAVEAAARVEVEWDTRVRRTGLRR